MGRKGSDEEEKSNAVAATLHGAIAEELQPIQTTLSVTEKNMQELSVKFNMMDAVLNELVQ